jgi:hypothetical protein
MSDRVVICEFEDVIKHSIPNDLMFHVRSAINENLTGISKANIVQGCTIVANPDFVGHPNYDKVVEAHYKLNCEIEVPVLVRIYNDGTRELKVIK